MKLCNIQETGKESSKFQHTLIKQNKTMNNNKNGQFDGVKIKFVKLWIAVMCHMGRSE